MSPQKTEEDPDAELTQLFDNIRSFGKTAIEKGQQLKERILPDAEPEEPLREILARIETRLTNIERAVIALHEPEAKLKKAKKKKAKKES
jgi:hypothetical protein